MSEFNKPVDAIEIITSEFITHPLSGKVFYSKDLEDPDNYFPEILDTSIKSYIALRSWDESIVFPLNQSDSSCIFKAYETNSIEFSLPDSLYKSLIKELHDLYNTHLSYKNIKDGDWARDTRMGSISYFIEIRQESDRSIVPWTEFGLYKDSEIIEKNIDRCRRLFNFLLSYIYYINNER
jgi:hypothetical protein